MEQYLKMVDQILMTEWSRVGRTLNLPQAVSVWEPFVAEAIDLVEVLKIVAEGSVGRRAVMAVVVQDSHEKVAVEALNSLAVADIGDKGYHVVQVVGQTTARYESDHSQVEQVAEVMVVVVDLIDSIFRLLFEMVAILLYSCEWQVCSPFRLHSAEPY